MPGGRPRQDVDRQLVQLAATAALRARRAEALAAAAEESAADETDPNLRATYLREAGEYREAATRYRSIGSEPDAGDDAATG